MTPTTTPTTTQTKNPFTSLFASGSRDEDAAELFERAATEFKLSKNYGRAADAYADAAKCRERMKETHDAASAHAEAGHMYKRCSQIEACVEHYTRASEMFAEMGRLSQSAKHLKEIGEVFENAGNAGSGGDDAQGLYDRAVSAYARAAELYESEEGSSATANNVKLKTAFILSAKLDRDEDATEIFEDVGRASLSNNLLRFSVKGYFLSAGICRMCWCDAIGVMNAVDKYDELDPSFNGTRERDLLLKCAKAFENGDQDEFSSAVADFDSMSRLDAWKTTMLLKAKKRIVARQEAEEDDLT